MKGFIYTAAILALLSVPVLAGAKVKHHHVTLGTPVTVGSTTFAPGQCIVSYEDTGATVQVTLKQGEMTSVTVPANLVKADHPYVSLTTKTVDGQNHLNEIQLDHVSLVFEGAEVASNTEPKPES